MASRRQDTSANTVSVQNDCIRHLTLQPVLLENNLDSAAPACKIGGGATHDRASPLFGTKLRLDKGVKRLELVATSDHELPPAAILLQGAFTPTLLALGPTHSDIDGRVLERFHQLQGVVTQGQQQSRPSWSAPTSSPTNWQHAQRDRKASSSQQQRGSAPSQISSSGALCRRWGQRHGRQPLGFLPLARLARSLLSLS